MKTFFYQTDVPDQIVIYELIAERLGINITGEDIWKSIRFKWESPHIGNTYLTLLFKKIEDELRKKYPGIPISHYINACDSHLYVNEEEIHTYKDYQDAIAAYEKMLDEPAP